MKATTFKNYSADERLKRAKAQSLRVCNTKWVWRVLGAVVGGAMAYALSTLSHSSVTATTLSVVSWSFCWGVWTNAYIVFRKVRYLKILSGESIQRSYKDLILRLRNGVDRSAVLVVCNPGRTDKLNGKREYLFYAALYSDPQGLDAEAALLVNEARSDDHWDPELVTIYDDLGRVGTGSGVVLEPLRDGFIRSSFDKATDYRAQVLKEGLGAVAALAVEFGERPEQWAMVCSMVEIANRAPGRDGAVATYQRVGKTVRTLVSASALTH